jgi:serine/threonine-protein kinase
MAEADLSGKTLIGKYRIEGRIGQGGMGSVWAAVHARTGRKVAIKFLDERFRSNPNVVERFSREARAASAIRHPGIVEVLDIDHSEDGVPFLVMERLTGETLADRLERRTRLSQAETLDVVRQLLEGLDAAHAHGVVHRDLKPDNIFLVPRAGGGEAVKILDFGISQKDDERVSHLTVEGSVLGTPHYMAPEQALGTTHIDGRADVYALGVVMYECLTGDVPYDAPNYNRLIQVILNETPPPPSTRGVQVDPSIERVLSWALEKKPEARPQSARAMLDELLRIQRGDSSGVAASRSSDAGASRSSGAGASGSSDAGASGSSGSQPSFADLKLDIPATGRSVRPHRGSSSFPVPTVHPAPSRSQVALEDEPESTDSLELDESALAPARRVPSRLRTDGHPSVVSSAPPASSPRMHSSAGRYSTPGMHSSAGLQTSPGAHSSAGTTGAFAAGDELPSRRKRAVWIAVGVLMIGVSLFASRGLWWPAPPEMTEVSPRVDPRPETPPDRVVPDDGTVLIEVEGLPVGAELRLDGLPAGDPPLRMRRGRATHRLEISAPGYETRSIEFEADGDHRLVGSLRPQIGITQ